MHEVGHQSLAPSVGHPSPSVGHSLPPCARHVVERQNALAVSVRVRTPRATANAAHAARGARKTEPFEQEDARRADRIIRRARAARAMPLYEGVLAGKPTSFGARLEGCWMLVGTLRIVCD